MWRSRQWRKLLNLIDHLPQDSFFNEAVANNEDHVRAILTATKGEKGDGAPRLADWSSEVAMLSTLINEVRSLKQVMVQVNMPKGKKAPAVEPYPTPRTVFEKVRHEQKQAAHETLAARMLRRTSP